MKEFIELYKKKEFERGWNLGIYHSSIMDWCITVGYKNTHRKHGETIIDVQDNDIDYAFAKAQVLLKDWLLEHEEGY